VLKRFRERANVPDNRVQQRERGRDAASARLPSERHGLLCGVNGQLRIFARGNAAGRWICFAAALSVYARKIGIARASPDGMAAPLGQLNRPHLT